MHKGINQCYVVEGNGEDTYLQYFSLHFSLHLSLHFNNVHVYFNDSLGPLSWSMRRSELFMFNIINSITISSRLSALGSHCLQHSSLSYCVIYLVPNSCSLFLPHGQTAIKPCFPTAIQIISILLCTLLVITVSYLSSRVRTNSILVYLNSTLSVMLVYLIVIFNPPLFCLRNRK